MKRRFAAGWTALGIVGAAVGVAPAGVLAMTMPAEERNGQVTYVTGGIGKSEAHLFERRLARHGLVIELLEHAGKTVEFTANAQVKVVDAHGHEVLDTRAGGPFLLVDVPPGRYSVVAMLGHARLRKAAVDVRPGDVARATFEFPAHSD